MIERKIFVIACLLVISRAHPIDPPDDVDDLFRSFADLELYNDEDLAEYRLSDVVWPTNYHVELTPHFDRPTEDHFPMTGMVEISFVVHSTTSSVTLHANLLEIDNDKWEFRTEGTALPHADSFACVEATHKCTFSLSGSGTFAVGQTYTLTIHFTGILDDSMRGFYRSYYNEGTNKKWIGTTQFQQIDARRAFPCFDEPKFKATFVIEIIRPVDYKPTIGNTKIANSSPVEGSQNLMKDTFAPTPIMSSYLVAFIVQQYTWNQTTDGHYGVYARPEAQPQMDYAFTVGEQLLDKMGEWVDYPFDKVPQIKKLDMIAVPDFSAGAMENWGAMTYRETNLLWDPVESTVLNKQRIAAVLTHEIAHLWFGDLVTCEWWSETWLNEGFARFFQYFGTDLVEDKMDLELQFVVEQVQGVFQMDSGTATHPMTNPHVFTPAQVSNMFSSISYNKGASIIRWMQHYVGKDNFKKILQNYIKANEYKTVLPANLFLHFEAVVPSEDITTIFTPWTEQSGYPLVTVESLPNNIIRLTQKRFLLDPKEDKTRWTIPITFAVNSSDFHSTETRGIFHRANPEYIRTLPSGGDLGFYILNVQQVGYYRVNYDAANWEAIRRALQRDHHGHIHVINRAQIVDDLFNLAQSGEISYSLTMDVVDYLVKEKNYIPWLSAFNGLTHLSRRIAYSEELKNFEDYINYLISDIYDHLEFQPKDSDSHIDRLNRVNVLNWACKHKHPGCDKAVEDEFTKFKQGGIVKADIRAPVYCHGMRKGKLDDFNILWNRFLTTNVAHEQVVILQALGCTKDKDLLKKYLDNILTDSIRPQDKNTCFNNAINGNNENVDLTLDYLIENFKIWDEKMGNVASSLSSVSTRFTRVEQIVKMEQFATDNQLELGEAKVNTIRAAATRARTNIEWDKKRLTEVNQWIVRKKDSGGGANAISVTFSVMLISILGYFIF